MREQGNSPGCCPSFRSGLLKSTLDDYQRKMGTPARSMASMSVKSDQPTIKMSVKSDQPTIKAARAYATGWDWGARRGLEFRDESRRFMRLTLRTLLAYRDSVLDNKDTLLLESKLRDSVTAQQISQRIDEGMSNPRLAPIPVDAKEFGFDPNHIAEYLDDTIPLDQIPALERCCLENNALLSEVGSCHRILTKALSAPLEVPRELRDRILAMPMTPNVKPSRLKILRLGKDGSTARFDAPTIGKFEAVYTEESSTSSNEHAPLATVRLTSTEPRGSGIELNEGLGHQVPEYLMGSDRSWLRTALVGSVLVIALVFVGALAIGPVDQLRSMLTVENRPVDGKPIPTQTDAKDSSQGVRKREPSDAAPKSNGETKKNEVASGANQPERNEDSQALKSVEDGKQTNNSYDAELGGVSEDGLAELPTGDTASIKASSVDSVADSQQISPTKELDSQGSRTEQESIAPDTSAVRWLPESKESTESLVIYSNPVDPESLWQRATPGSGLSIGDIIVTPYQRTEFVTGTGVRMIACDASQLECNGPAPIYIHYGKFLLFPTPAGNEVRLVTPNGLLRIVFQEQSTSCAVEVRHIWDETTSDEIANAKINTRVETKIYGIQGTLKVDWKEKEISQSVDLAVGEIALLVGTESIAKTEMESAPAWFRSTVGRSIDQFAWQDANKYLKREENKSLPDALAELAQSKRAETASFAVRVLCQLGRFDSLFASGGFLARKGAYTHLQVWLTELPSLLGSAETKEAFVQSVSTNLESRTNDILRLLVTQSASQLRDGGERLLIESLSSNQQAERLLAIVQLTSLTGKTLGFHPEKNSTEAVAQWRKLLVKEDSRPSQSN
jgi:hypothetical protein